MPAFTYPGPHPPPAVLLVLGPSLSRVIRPSDTGAQSQAWLPAEAGPSGVGALAQQGPVRPGHGVLGDWT